MSSIGSPSKFGFVRGGEPAPIPGTGRTTKGAQSTSSGLGIASLDQNAAAVGTLSLHGQGASSPAVAGMLNQMLSGAVNADAAALGEQIALTMSPEQRAHLDGVKGAFTLLGEKRATPEMVEGKFSSFLGSFINPQRPAPTVTDVNALVQYVLREAYLDNTKDLQAYAERVQFINAQKQCIRDYQSQLRDYDLKLKEYLSSHGYSTMPTDPAELQDYMEKCAEFYSNNAHPVRGYAEAQAQMSQEAAKALQELNGLIDKAALTQGAQKVVSNAASMYEEKFGLPLPDEIKEAMGKMLTEAMGPPENPQRLRDALFMFASYLSFSSDTSTVGGVYGGGSGYDDVVKFPDAAAYGADPTGPNIYDFVYYLGADAGNYLNVSDFPPEQQAGIQAVIDATSPPKSDPNKIARGNLHYNDVKMVEAVFGMPEGTLTGQSCQAIVEQAMERSDVTWKNEVLFNQKVSNDEIAASIQQYGLASPYVESIFGNLGLDAKAQLNVIKDWLNNSSVGRSLSEEAYEALGLPYEVPPPDCQTPDAIENFLKELEEKMATLGEDGQLASLALQDMLQKQQQTLQTMSNCSKMVFDTAKSVIQKIG